jgi:hypothetical protein
MGNIKNWQDAEINQSREAAEQNSGELEGTNDAQQLRAIEEEIACKTDQAKKLAAQKLDVVVAEGGEQFRQFCVRARSLLDEQWPLSSPIAMPHTPSTAGVTAL